MGALHAACLKSAADSPEAGRYTDFSGARRRLQKWPQNRGGTPLGPSGPTNFDSPPHFTPTPGGRDPFGAVAPHPNGQKGSKKVQKAMAPK